MSDYKAALSAHVQQALEAERGFSAGEGVQVQLRGKLGDIFLQILSKASEFIHLSPEDAQSIIDAALSVYDTYVAVLDLPGVPNFLEPVIKKAVRQSLEAALRSVLGQVIDG